MEGAQPVVSFDLDGVLIRNPFARGVMPHLYRLLRQTPVLRDLSPDEAEGRTLRAVRAAVAKRMQAGRLVEAYDWDAIFTEVSLAFGGSGVPDVAALVQHYCAQPGVIALLPGAVEGLTRLRAHGVRVVALTNGYARYQLPVLRALGVLGWLEAVLTPDEVGSAKPHEGIFRAVPGLVAHVGDTLLHDVYGAKQAGLVAVWCDATLPAPLRALPIAARTHHDTFLAHLRHAFESDLYRPFHPEASLAACIPDAVVSDPEEAAAFLLTKPSHAEEAFAAWHDPARRICLCCGTDLPAGFAAVCGVKTPCPFCSYPYPIGSCAD